MFNSKLVHTPVVTDLKLRKGKSKYSVDSTYFKILICSLRYLIATRPNILYRVSLLSRYIETLTQNHLQTEKRILWYIRSILSHDIFYSYSNDATLVGYSDSDWVRNVKIDYNFIRDLISKGEINLECEDRRLLQIFSRNH